MLAQAQYMPIESIQISSSGVTAMRLTPAEVAEALGLDLGQLQQLAVLCGNDFTKHEIASNQVANRRTELTRQISGCVNGCLSGF